MRRSSPNTLIVDAPPGAASTIRVPEGETTMADKSDTSAGLTQEERDAVKQRAKELREQEKAGKNRAAGEKSVLDAIAQLEPDDKALAEGFYRVVSEVAPDLVPKTYYGMPGFANGDGKIVVFMQPAHKFKTRYATIGFEDRANLDDGDVWPVAFAVRDWTPAVEQKFTELVRTAVG
ncbi:MAG: hypothetical protein K0S05_1964 [Agromyces sp.]|nr:hypothetical protein [Agromyces sp.]